MKRRLWLRLGVSLYITEAEETVIFGDNSEGKADEALRKIIAEGRFKPDGDTYIPEVTVEEYNQKYGTSYEVGDTDFDL